MRAPEARASIIAIAIAACGLVPWPARASPSLPTLPTAMAVRAARVESLVPGFSAQLALILADQGLEALPALDKALDFAASDPQNLKILVQGDEWKSIEAGFSRAFAADGDLKEWAGLPWVRNDPSGDGFQKRSDFDILSGGAYKAPGDPSLRLFMRLAAPPAAGQTLQFLIECSGGEGLDLSVYAWKKDNGPFTARWKKLATGEEAELPASSWSVSGAFFEASVDLDALFPPQSRRAYTTVTPSSLEWKTNFYESSPTIDLPEGLINHALYLYLDAAGRGLAIEGDAIAAALALANAGLFREGKAETRRLLRADIASHFALYKEIIAWQASIGFRFPLAACPLLPKLMWADRASYSYFDLERLVGKAADGRIGAEAYLQFVDRVETLRLVHGKVKSEELLLPAMDASAERIEEWVHRMRTYRSSMENLEYFNRIKTFSDADMREARAEYAAGKYYATVAGEKRRWDEQAWMNRQWELFAKGGKFKGDCGTTTVVQMAFYRGAGIAPVSQQWIHEAGDAALTHNCPGHYDPLLGRWMSYQSPDVSGIAALAGKAGRQFLFYAFPDWNPWERRSREYRAIDGIDSFIDNRYQGELSANARLVSLLRLGLDRGRMEALFFSGRSLEKGLLFDEATAPPALVDADKDGLYAPWEAGLGSSDQNTDTDGDGLSDRQEASLGFSPLSAASPGPEGARPWMLKPVFEPSWDWDAWAAKGMRISASPATDLASGSSLMEGRFAAPPGIEISQGLFSVSNPETALEYQSTSYRVSGGWVIGARPAQSGSYYLRIYAKEGKGEWGYLGRFRLESIGLAANDAPPGTRVLGALPAASQDFHDFGCQWRSPVAGDFLVDSAEPFSFSLTLPAGYEPWVSLYGSDGKEIRRFTRMEFAGGTLTFYVMPPGKGTFNLYASFHKGDEWHQAAAFRFGSSAAPSWPREAGIETLAPYQFYSTEFSRFGLLDRGEKRGKVRTDGRPVSLELEARAEDGFWQSVQDKAGKEVPGAAYCIKTGKNVTIVARPLESGSYTINYGVIPPGKEGIWCGSFELEVAKAPTWGQSPGFGPVNGAAKGGTAKGQSPLIIQSWPIIGPDFRTYGLSMSELSVGGQDLRDGQGIFELSAPPGTVFGLSTRNEMGEWVQNAAEATMEGDRARIKVKLPLRGKYDIFLHVVDKGEWKWVAQFLARW